jgi:hypothetical protein
MPKPNRPTPPRPNREQTSAAVASIAGELLNGNKFSVAVTWLEEVSMSANYSATDHAQAAVILTVIEAVRSVAGSALTQVPNRTR